MNRYSYNPVVNFHLYLAGINLHPIQAELANIVDLCVLQLNELVSVEQ